MKKRALFFFLVFFSLTGCQKYYLALYQENIGPESLASTYVGSPDPRQKNPPIGQQVILEWQIPQEILEEKPSLHLDVIYRDYSESHFTYPITSRAGYEVYSLTNKEYETKKGLLAYQAKIQTGDGKVFRSWRHQMWVQVIRFEEEPSDESIPSFPPKVYEDEEEESATFFPPDS